MKIKTTIAALSLLITGASVSDAAVLAISNIGNLTSDTLYADKNNTLMSGGVVTIGYFNSAAINPTTINGLYSNLANFVVVSTGIPGTALSSLGDMMINGYADNAALTLGAIGGSAPASTGQLLTGNTLIGRNYYSIVSSFATLAAAAAAPLDTSNQLALVLLGTLPNEDTGELSFNSDPATGSIKVGSTGSFTGDIGFAENTYSTLKMAVVPEPSAALLGAIGALGLLRRRRI